MPPKSIPPLDKILTEYDQFAVHPNTRRIQYISIPLITFGLLGLIWAIPFPHLNFIGKYNGFVNWASFVIAFSIYYYYRLSPVLSYGTLLLVFVFSGGIVGLEKVEHSRAIPNVGTICLAIFILGIAIQYLGFSIQKKFPGAFESLKGLLVGPLWLVAEAFKKSGVKLKDGKNSSGI